MVRSIRHEVSRSCHAAAVSLILALSAHAATAQTTQRTETGGGWQVQVTPYLWAAGLKGDMATLPNLPTVHVDESFSDILEDTDFALMIVGEARKGRWGLSLNLSYLSTSADASLPGPNFSGADVDSTTFFGTPVVSYRAYEDRSAALDLGAGLRIWYVRNELSLRAGTQPAVNTKESETWADPIVAVRGALELGSGFSVVAYGDIGGFGIASDSTWQLMGLVGYRFNDWIDGVIGYRHLSVDYENDGFVWDVEMSGPILGVTFRF